MSALRYCIQRLDDGVWVHKSNYGQDLDTCMQNARWFQAMGHGRVKYRVVAQLGDAVSVLLQ